MKALIPITLLVAVVLAGCSNDQKPKSISDFSGEQLYDATCLSCHGNVYEGNTVNSLNGIGKEKTAKEIEEVILHPPKGMPNNIINQEGAKKIAEWLVEETK